jgi:endoglucanase
VRGACQRPVASAVSGQTVTVSYADAMGTATKPGDYAGKAGTLTFAPGETTKTITVAVKGATAVEADETFFLDLSNATGASIARARGTGTITNDDVSD